jgi:hypothetical protein
VSNTGYRIVFTLLGLGLGLVVVFFVLFAPDGGTVDRPPVIERLAPGEDATVLRQTALEIDMAAGYRIEVYVDGIRIPDPELDVVEPTASYVWIPGPTKTFAEWTPGVHTVRITWERTTGLADVGEYRWSFRVQ